MWAFGASKYGQIGDGQARVTGFASTPNPTPTKIAGLSHIVAISGGGLVGLALDDQGQIWSWGYNEDGALGIASSDTGLISAPVKVKQDSTCGVAKAISVGGDGFGDHALMIGINGVVCAWGNNRSGQLGIGSSNIYIASPTALTSISDIVAISAGANHSLALKNFGVLYVFGDNTYYQLSTSSFMGSLSPFEAASAGTRIKYSTIAAGSVANHIMTTAADVLVPYADRLFLWGKGQASDGSNTNCTAYCQPAGYDPDQTDLIAAGSNYSLLTRKDGSLWSWGDNTYGQLGGPLLTSPTRYFPAKIADNLGGQKIVAISAAYRHSVALTADGRVWTWGDNTYGQLGRATPIVSYLPTEIAGFNAKQ